jgi:IS5 family transposase
VMRAIKALKGREPKYDVDLACDLATCVNAVRCRHLERAAARALKKAGYRGLAKNAAQLFRLFDLAILLNAFSATAN